MIYVLLTLMALHIIYLTILVRAQKAVIREGNSEFNELLRGLSEKDTFKIQEEDGTVHEFNKVTNK